ncbi:hypothetical protein [Catellatospora sp. NPDC049133]|uniref:hypothetical protein n=1 Tax=Catellatospora sp. NPDC049133 TaxID=3155499 RepID=UPI0033C38125
MNWGFTEWQTPGIVPRMTTGDVPGEVRRWKLIALVSALSAVAAAAALVGWTARGWGGDAAPTSATFTGGGQTTSNICEPQQGTWFRNGAIVKILSAEGEQLATGRILNEPVWGNGGCHQEFVVDGIPERRSVYVVEVGRWRHPVTEEQLRANTAEVMLI